MTEKQECRHGKKYRVNCITCYNEWIREQGKQEGIRIGLEKAITIIDTWEKTSYLYDAHKTSYEIKTMLKSALSESEKK